MHLSFSEIDFLLKIHRKKPYFYNLFLEEFSLSSPKIPFVTRNNVCKLCASSVVHARAKRMLHYCRKCSIHLNDLKILHDHVIPNIHNFSSIPGNRVNPSETLNPTVCRYQRRARSTNGLRVHNVRRDRSSTVPSLAQLSCAFRLLRLPLA